MGGKICRFIYSLHQNSEYFARIVVPKQNVYAAEIVTIVGKNKTSRLKLNQKITIVEKGE